ncbi:hypothetical protein [Paenibacillus taichungensis]
MKAIISNKIPIMEAVDPNVEFSLSENVLTLRFQYHPSKNVDFDPWRTIGVNANQFLNAVQSLMGLPAIKYEVNIQSDSYNTYPIGTLKISSYADINQCRIELDYRANFYFDREEVIEALKVLIASCGSD